MSYIGNQPLYTSYVTDRFSGNGSTLAYTLSIAPANSASLLVVIFGVLQDPSAYGVAGNTLTFTSAPPTGTNNISVRYLGLPASNVVTSAYRTVTDIVATAGQTTFSTASYTPGFIDVYRNGAKLATADYTATNGAQVVLANAAAAGDIIQTVSFSVSSVLNAIPANAGVINSGYLADGSVTSTKLTPGSVTSTVLDVGNSNGTGAVQLPTGTLAQRPSVSAGRLRYNTQLTALEFYAAGSVNSWITLGAKDGSSPSAAAPSGYYLAQNFSGVLTSGYYWIQSSSMPAPIRMYVDMTQEGGGYDFYAITGGIAVTDINATHSGTALGLDLVMPRSKQHWIAMRNFVSGVLGSGDLTYFANVPGIYRTGGSGNYTGFIMRNPTSYGSGAPDWRVKDGGRWWLRDTTYTEPNGDYNLNGFLGDMARGGFGTGYAGGDLLFNDGGSYTTGGSYLVSTNAKP
jgi:hypothetical protein